MGTPVHSTDTEYRSVSIRRVASHNPCSFCARAPAKPCRRAGRKPKNGPWRRAPAGPTPEPDSPGRKQPEFQVTSDDRIPLWRTLLNGWMVIAARFGSVQTLLIL